MQHVKAFHSFGISFGTVFAMRAAPDISGINKIVINLTYGSLADNVWTCVILQHIVISFTEAGQVVRHSPCIIGGTEA